MKSAIVGLLCISASLVSNRTEKLAPKEPNAMNIVTFAENFARHHNIKPTELLILETGSVLMDESFNLRANLLVVTRPIDDLMNQTSSMVTLYLDVLETSLKVIVVSREVPNIAEPFQNFRHNCILHVTLDTRIASKFVNTLYWSSDYYRKFYCVHSFDQMMFWRSEEPMRMCSKTKRKFSIHSLFFVKYLEYKNHIMRRPEEQRIDLPGCIRSHEESSQRCSFQCSQAVFYLQDRYSEMCLSHSLAP